MKLTKEILREHKIYNSHDICRVFGGKIYLTYHAPDGRRCMSAKWVAQGVGIKTDPDGPWYNNGMKTFIGKMRSPALDEAKRWANEQYGISDWLRDPWGCWQDSEVVARAQFNIVQGMTA